MEKFGYRYNFIKINNSFFKTPDSDGIPVIFCHQEGAVHIKLVFRELSRSKNCIIEKFSNF